MAFAKVLYEQLPLARLGFESSASTHRFSSLTPSTMKSFAVTGLLASTAAAFPAAVLNAIADGTLKAPSEMVARAAVASPQGVGALPLTPPPFDAAAQYVSNQGEHRFIAPGPGDERGECPGCKHNTT